MIEGVLYESRVFDSPTSCRYHRSGAEWKPSFANQAKPCEEIRKFPFYHAGNLLVPVIAIFSDGLQARVISAQCGPEARKSSTHLHVTNRANASPRLHLRVKDYRLILRPSVESYGGMPNKLRKPD